MLDRLIGFLNDLGSNLRLVDLLDIAVVAAFLYLSFLWLRRTASRSLLLTVTLVIGLYFVARTFDMYLTSSLFQVGFTAIMLGLILIFQEDIRRALESLTAWGTSRDRARPSTLTATIDTLVEAVSNLAEKRIGALLVFPGREILERHIHGGVPVRGIISIPLLQSIFDPHSPGHDGAVSIEGDRIDRLAVHLPLSENLAEIGSLGTRHAAALGLAERSDALVVVVSEERGTVSIAANGRLDHSVSSVELKRRLSSHYERRYPARPQRHWGRWLAANPGLKFASVALACLLWGLLAFRVEKLQRTFDGVPVEFRNVPEGFALDEPLPTSVNVTLSGSERAFALLNANSLKVSLDMQDVQPGPQEIALRDDHLANVPRGLSVEQVQPSRVWLTAYRVRFLRLPVRVQWEGKLPEHLTLKNFRADPSSVRVLFHQSDDPAPAAIPTRPVNLSQISGPTTVRALLDPPSGVRFVEPRNGTVQVTIETAEKPKEAAASAQGPQ